MKSQTLPVFTNAEYNKLLACVQEEDVAEPTRREIQQLALHFLLLAFNPLVVRVAQRYRARWAGEFDDLLMLVRCRFVRLIHRRQQENGKWVGYEVGGRWVFRYFIATALWRDVRDQVYKDRRQQGLEDWSDQKPVPPTPLDGDGREPEISEGFWVRETDPAADRDAALELEQVLRALEAHPEITGPERAAFLMFVQGHSVWEIRRAVPGGEQINVRAVVRRVRELLLRQFRPERVARHQVWIMAPPEAEVGLRALGIELGEHDATFQMWDHCAAPHRALEALNKLRHEGVVWGLCACGHIPEQETASCTSN